MWVYSMTQNPSSNHQTPFLTVTEGGRGWRRGTPSVQKHQSYTVFFNYMGAVHHECSTKSNYQPIFVATSCKTFPRCTASLTGTKVGIWWVANSPCQYT